jgi:hypothetical protein
MKMILYTDGKDMYGEEIRKFVAIKEWNEKFLENEFVYVRDVAGHKMYAHQDISEMWLKVVNK